jgi:hypothetical protein
MTEITKKKQNIFNNCLVDYYTVTSIMIGMDSRFPVGRCDIPGIQQSAHRAVSVSLSLFREQNTWRTRYQNKFFPRANPDAKRDPAIPLLKLSPGFGHVPTRARSAQSPLPSLQRGNL